MVILTSGAGYIGTFNTADNVGNYANTGTRHAIVITCVNSDGSATYYDPQLGTSGTLSASDMGKVGSVVLIYRFLFEPLFIH